MNNEEEVMYQPFSRTVDISNKYHFTINIIQIIVQTRANEYICPSVFARDMNIHRGIWSVLRHILN